MQSVEPTCRTTARRPTRRRICSGPEDPRFGTDPPQGRRIGSLALGPPWTDASVSRPPDTEPPRWDRERADRTREKPRAASFGRAPEADPTHSNASRGSLTVYRMCSSGVTGSTSRVTQRAVQLTDRRTRPSSEEHGSRPAEASSPRPPAAPTRSLESEEATQEDQAAASVVARVGTAARHTLQGKKPKGASGHDPAATPGCGNGLDSGTKP
jgi:hypothetical protein